MKHFYKQGIYLVIFLSLGIIWQGCNVVNPEEPVPTYIHIDSFQFVANPSFPDATTSHNISTVWAYYNDNPIGVFDLPCTFPVITTGANADGKLSFGPGVPVNGFNNILSGYAFYTIDTTHFKAQPGKVINYTPKTTYFSASKIVTIANFENGVNYFSVINGTSGLIPIQLSTDKDLVFEGVGVGVIELTHKGDSSIDSTVNYYSIPYGKSNEFLEINYKSTLPFYIGIQADALGISTKAFYLAGINPSDHWQKFYIALQDFVAEYQGGAYKFYIKTVLPDGQASGKLLLDNIQLVTF